MLRERELTKQNFQSPRNTSAPHSSKMTGENLFLFLHSNSRCPHIFRKRAIRWCPYGIWPPLICIGFTLHTLVHAGEAKKITPTVHIWWDRCLIPPFWPKIFTLFISLCIPDIQVFPAFVQLPSCRWSQGPLQRSKRHSETLFASGLSWHSLLLVNCFSSSSSPRYSTTTWLWKLWWLNITPDPQKVCATWTCLSAYSHFFCLCLVTYSFSLSHTMGSLSVFKNPQLPPQPTTWPFSLPY